MYHLDKILAICFLINFQQFVLHIIFVLVKRYLTHNLNNKNIDNNKDKQIYQKMHIADR